MKQQEEIDDEKFCNTKNQKLNKDDYLEYKKSFQFPLDTMHNVYSLPYYFINEYFHDLKQVLLPKKHEFSVSKSNLKYENNNLTKSMKFENGKKFKLSMIGVTRQS